MYQGEKDTLINLHKRLKEQNYREKYIASNGVRFGFKNGGIDKFFVTLLVPEETGLYSFCGPLDTEYFGCIDELSKKYKSKKLNIVITDCIVKLFNDTNIIYTKTKCDELNPSVLQKVEEFICNLIEEGMDAMDANHLLNSILSIYLGMIAENNKKGTVVGSGMKTNGILKITLNEEDVNVAANSSRGKKAKDIFNELREQTSNWNKLVDYLQINDSTWNSLAKINNIYKKKSEI